MDSHLLRDSKHWSERVNIFYQIFVNLLTKSTLIYPFLDISSEKRFTRHMFVYQTTRRKETSLQAANAAEISQPKAKDPSHINVNMVESCEKIPRLKWPCVLQPLHVQSSTFNRNYLLGS